MANQADVRRVALSLPGVTEGEDRFGFSVLNKGKHKGLAWSWAERVDPKKPRVVKTRCWRFESRVKLTSKA